MTLAMPTAVRRKSGPPHFGHWLDVSWPSIRHTHYPPAGCPILSLNTLRPYTIKVPVKASVYERVQQTGFWVSAQTSLYAPSNKIYRKFWCGHAGSKYYKESSQNKLPLSNSKTFEQKTMISQPSISYLLPHS
jgi:hypothetical protein